MKETIPNERENVMKPIQTFGRQVRVLLCAASLVLACSVAAGCGGQDETPVSSTGETIDSDGAVELEGFVVIRDGRGRLCEVLRESFPPQCGDPAVEIANIEAIDVELTTAQGVSWTDQRVTLTGEVDSGVLTVK